MFNLRYRFVGLRHIQVFREEVGRVEDVLDLHDLDTPPEHVVLYPQLMSRYVAYFAVSSSTCYRKSSSSIGEMRSTKCTPRSASRL